MKRLNYLKLLLFRRGVVLIATLLFAACVVIIWLLATRSSQSDTGVVIGIAAISAVFGAVSAFATLLQGVEIQRQRENQERPYVLAYFNPANNGALYFVIENFGNAPALDILVKFDPSPVNFAGQPLNELSLFQTPISFLPPGKSMHQLIDAANKLLAEGKPTKYKISFVYVSIYGQKYSDSIEIDLSYYRDSTLPFKSIEEHLGILTGSIKRLTDVIEKFDEINHLPYRKVNQYRRVPAIDVEEKSVNPPLKAFFHWFLSKIE